MGNIEKIVVLTVLLASAAVLAFSLSTGDEEQSGSPLADAERANRGASTTAHNPTVAGATKDKKATGLTLTAEGRKSGPERTDGAGAGLGLGDGAGDGTGDPRSASDAGLGADALGAAPPPQVDAQGRPRVLRSRQGLTPSPLDDYMLYTAAAGDTWSSLADRFYRSGTFVPLLQAANEDLERPVAGETLLVPVYDFRAAAADHQPRDAAPARAADARTADAATSPSSSGASPTSASAKRTVKPPPHYVVEAGDSLSEISVKVYGTATRWNDIFEANRDVLEDPDTLDVGTKLRIP